MDHHLRLLSLSIPNVCSSSSHQGMRARNIPALFSTPTLSGSEFLPMGFTQSDSYTTSVPPPPQSHLNYTENRCIKMGKKILWRATNLFERACCQISPGLRTLKAPQCRKQNWMHPCGWVYTHESLLAFLLSLSDWVGLKFGQDHRTGSWRMTAGLAVRQFLCKLM